MTVLCRLRHCHLSTPTLCRRFHDARVYKEDKRWPGWQVVVGIETHAQIKSRRKLFSGKITGTNPDEPPNKHVSPFDAAFPGTLPKLNSKCVDLAIRTALALKSDIQHRSSFDRKHYFYSDLPSGYQITQQYAPIALRGQLNIQMPNSSAVPVRIKQIQLEQDTAKSTLNPRKRISNIDLNRAGAGLMEIVSEPDLRSPEEAGMFVRTLQAVLRAIGASDGNMEQGSLRCDVNVSVNRVGRPPGTRCEIKNLNSVKFMMAAITHEIIRQRAILESASDLETCTVPQETRGFDENTFETYRLRSKEDAPDYRYMPDPNLGVLVLSQDRVQAIRDSLPELPWETRHRLREMYALSERDIDVLLSVDSGREVTFDGEKDVDGSGAVAMTHELLGQLSARKETFTDNSLTSDHLGELIDLVQNGTITGTSGKYLLRHMLAKPSSLRPAQITQQLRLTSLSSFSSSGHSNPTSTTDQELTTLCQAAITALPNEVAAVRAGNKNVMNKIVGRVMRESRGRADAKGVKALVEELILGGGDKS
ncbi:uncharacterized protein LACBIDRAFT_231681 [Laccaria bicolor S238N-H82]|uniref:Glutamyl-tRNA(Gln) amidotransferase subunit B, mitochondrial n=1 Tax=Laccaria bicolor (strain S238N-H82 / ATCC MYA-4686) TaxID=486041 RepID=GATB_LACBS|nr:uncharacterized protein LACBIDRAFT_231681 [Laccaria bicolor S238N-H82]B0CXE1.1 RecName: Full=Glutamyl-tRNA(Gln) amidotransferase subunit B, mitochondrial; Short=Glu-AdT subunit B; Flags: Precursor [Laccaria bicolor S238N-H82]EDR12709.1 predicted protein [Laccaria bicolor S238N-H82]|eukprot:XP_001876973.1 predicted protein [Laccaria bicolor S238N-H82]